MSTPFKNVVIIGAGGNLGPSILKAFLDNGSFNITILSREGSTSTFPAGVKVVRADYTSHDSLVSAFQGQDAVLSLVGGTAFGDQHKYIDAAIAAGVKRFIPSEYGSNTADERVLEIVPALRAKSGTVEYLKGKQGAIEWSSVITGPFFDWGIKVGFLGFNAATKTATLIDNGTAPFSATNLYTIGQALISILLNHAETKNKLVYISSHDTTQAEILATVEKVSGEKWTVEHVKSEELKKQGDEKIAKHDYSGVVLQLQSANGGSQGLGDSRPVGLWNEKLGLEKESFEDSVKLGLAGKLRGE